MNTTRATAAGELHTHRLETVQMPPCCPLTIRPLPDGDGFELIGEADLATLAQLRAALSEFTAPVVHLRMAELRFMDICCLGELLNLARPPRCVVLHDPPAVVVRMLDALEPHDGVEVRHS